MIYLNNAATSFPKPPCVVQAMAQAIADPPGSMHRGSTEDESDVMSAVRLLLSRRLGVSDPCRIALGANATWGLNLAIFGMGLAAGSVVVTTKAEHNSVLRPLYLLEGRGVKVIYLDTDETGRVDPTLWADAMERFHPNLAVFTHASNVTGAVNDAAVLTAAAKGVGARVLLDASQTLGWLDLHAESRGVDMVAFTGHKYLLGPQGTGGLWVCKNLKLTPHLVGGTGIWSDSDTMPEEMPLRLEAGTGNEPSYHGLLSALEWANDNPRDVAACDQMIERLRSGLADLGARVILPRGECTPVISFNLPKIDSAELGYILTHSCEITCRTGLHCAPKIFTCLGEKTTVRLSLSRFTTPHEVECVLRDVEDIIAQ